VLLAGAGHNKPISQTRSKNPDSSLR